MKLQIVVLITAVHDDMRRLLKEVVLFDFDGLFVYVLVDYCCVITAELQMAASTPIN